jgi:hypothetical protein
MVIRDNAEAGEGLQVSNLRAPIENSNIYTSNAK